MIFPTSAAPMVDMAAVITVNPRSRRSMLPQGTGEELGSVTLQMGRTQTPISPGESVLLA